MNISSIYGWVASGKVLGWIDESLEFLIYSFYSRDRKRVRRSEERLDVSIATSENNFAATSGDERKRDKDRDTKDKDRRERRDRDKDRGKDREGKDKDRERKRSRRSRSRDRRDKDKERESRRDYPREDGVEPVRVKEEPPDEYENYPAQEEYEEYNNYDPENIKYESEGGEAHFQNEEYKKNVWILLIGLTLSYFFF